MSYRVLSSYQRIAQQEHYCQKCQGPILAGEEYEGVVSVTKAIYQGRRLSHIFVAKEHTNIGDCHDWDLELELHEAEEASRAREENAQKAVSLLAIMALAKSKTRRI